jgi:hypothetical protein
LQIFLLPPLAAGALAVVWGRIRWHRMALAIGSAAVLLAPAILDNGRRIAQTQEASHFTVEEAELAQRLQARLDPGSWVANAAGDGSAWVQALTDLRLTVPCGWALTPRVGLDLRQAALGLGQSPWSAETRELRSLGVGFVWASNVGQGRRPAFSREDLAQDPRFQLVDQAGPAAVFRILWDVEVDPGT